MIMTSPKKLSKLELMKIAKGPSEAAKLELARHVKTLPHDVINQLARDESHTVREVLAIRLFEILENGWDVPAEALLRLKNDEKLSIRHLINPTRTFPSVDDDTPRVFFN